MEAPRVEARTQKESGWENVKAADDQALFADVNADSPVTELESLCMQCEKQVITRLMHIDFSLIRSCKGTTRLLLTRIPFFKDIVLMSFSCPHCNWRNTEVQSASSIEEKVFSFSFGLPRAYG